MTNREQTCPFCDITEATGAYCTKCERATRLDWVHAKALSDAQRVARAAPRLHRAPRTRKAPLPDKVAA